MNKQSISWEQIACLSNFVATEIAKDCPDLSKAILVGVSRGGLIPTQLIAYRLDIRDIRTIKLISYDQENHRGEIKDISTDKLIDGRYVYFIDDLADSGATLKEIRNRFPNSRLCTLLKKSCCQEQPDICADESIKADTWIVFPWDK